MLALNEESLIVGEMFKDLGAGMEVVPSDNKYNLRWPDYLGSVLATFR